MTNCIISWANREGSKCFVDYLTRRMSPAALAANSTRELRKLTRTEREEAKKPNKGKYDKNAGGYLRSARGLGPAGAQEQGATKPKSKPKPKPKPASRRVAKYKKTQPTAELDYSADTEDQPPSAVFEQGHAHKRRRVREPSPPLSHILQNLVYRGPQGHAPLDPILDSGSVSELYGPYGPYGPYASSSPMSSNTPTGSAYAVPTPYLPAPEHWEGHFSGTVRRDLNLLASRPAPPPVQVDYRTVLPRNQQDVDHIQSALLATRTNYARRTGSECPPTSEHESYRSQVEEILHNFRCYWSFEYGHASALPDLITSREPWRGGFSDWKAATGGDEAFAWDL